MGTFKTEFQFTLPTGYLDRDGKVHRQGVMRLSKSMDEILPMEDSRVQANPAYATVLILARVITQLGTLEAVTPEVVEDFFAGDLNYLQQFYRQINGLEEPSHGSVPMPAIAADVA
jgi:hypothetical protein